MFNFMSLLGGVGGGGGGKTYSSKYNPSGDIGVVQGSDQVNQVLGLQANYLKQQDRGFFKHMTVSKARKGRNVKIMGTGC